MDGDDALGDSDLLISGDLGAADRVCMVHAMRAVIFLVSMVYCFCVILLWRVLQLFAEMEHIQAQLRQGNLPDFQRETLELRLQEIEDELAESGSEFEAQTQEEQEARPALLVELHSLMPLHK